VGVGNRPDGDHPVDLVLSGWSILLSSRGSELVSITTPPRRDVGLGGGRLRLVALTIFGLLGANEGHHVIQVIVKGSYDPGVLTSIPYCWVGVLMLIALWREHRGSGASAHRNAIEVLRPL
jgi:hypothetical protein